MYLKELEELEWNNILSNFKTISPDIYYFNRYYKSWISHEKAKPCCLYINIDGIDFIYPFFIKKIDGFDLSKTYIDIYTAYGYGGLLCSEINPYYNIVSKVNQLIDEWCMDNNVVSEFIRENRIFEIKGSYLRDIDHVQVRSNVYTDLNDKIENQLSKSAKRNIKIAKRSNLICSIHKEKKDIESYIKIYNKTMKKLNASKFYFFDSSFFFSLFEYMPGDIDLIMIWKENSLCAASLCFKSGNNYIYYLGVSDPKKSSIKPNDFLLYNIMRIAQEMNFKYVSLGGGTGNSLDDSLFLYKSRFGKLKFPCHIGKKIHRPCIYRKVCLQWEKRYPDLSNIYEGRLQKYHYID